MKTKNPQKTTLGHIVVTVADDCWDQPCALHEDEGPRGGVLKSTSHGRYSKPVHVFASAAFARAAIRRSRLWYEADEQPDMVTDMKNAKIMRLEGFCA